MFLDDEKMPRFISMFTFTALLFVQPAKAAEGEAMLSSASRFSTVVMQILLSSPPLPSPSFNSKKRLSIQGGYASGKIDGQYTIPKSEWNAQPFDSYYKGEPKALAIGLGYTSASRGRFSYFLYGLYMWGQSDVLQTYDSTPNTWWGIKDNKIVGYVAGAAANYLVLGKLNSPMNLSMFIGAQGISSKFDGGYGLATSSEEISAMPDDKMGAKSTSYGPVAGMQFKIRFGSNFAIIPYGLYYYDASSRCYEMYYEYMGQRANDKCMYKITSSYAAAGVNLVYRRLSFTAYSNVWNNVVQYDSKVNAYQLSYSFEF